MVGGTWERTTIPNNPQTTLHSQRNRNRPTHRRMQQTHGNISPNAKRNRRKMRRNLAAKMGRHRLRKQSRKHHSRKKQQPTSHTPKQQTLRNASNNYPKPTETEYFHLPNMPVDHFGTLLSHQRKRIAHKLSNPRLLKIHFHTFRYWKGTMLYHETKDMYYVMQALRTQKHQKHAPIRPT